MLSAQRHIEARIGELAGPAKHGGDRRSDQAHHDELDLIPNDQTRADVRILAQAAEAGVIANHEWQKSRRALVRVARRRPADRLNHPAGSSPGLSRAIHPGMDRSQARW
jgi:hypothetical protein